MTIATSPASAPQPETESSTNLWSIRLKEVAFDFSLDDDENIPSDEEQATTIEEALNKSYFLEVDYDTALTRLTKEQGDELTDEIAVLVEQENSWLVETFRYVALPSAFHPGRPFKDEYITTGGW